MKHMKSTSLLAGFLASAAVFSVGCSKQDDRPDQNWTSPVAISGGFAGLGGAILLHRYHDTLIGVQILDGGSAQLLILNRASNSWSQLNVAGAPDVGGWTYLWGSAAIDPQSKRIILPEGYAENEQLVMKVLMGTITENVGLRDVTEKEWITDKKILLGETGPNVKLNGPPIRPDRPNRNGAELGIGILNGPEAYIPYCLRGQTYRGKIVYVDEGPFNNGVFHSSDSGKTWQMEKISDFNFGAPDMCKTMGYYYYFVTRTPIIEYGLWFSRKPISEGAWVPPENITRTFANVDGQFADAGEGDTVHICWMDRRHNKWRFNIDAPPIENNEIFYHRRKDADRDWSKEVLLSKGLLYSYAPTISAEGDKVVVAWAGIQTASKQHTDMGPNDIYYVTSKDGGKTWTDPMKVTDGAKDGMTAGMPQVALLNGTIHLLYIQGKFEKAEELSPGLTRASKQPWSIYYTQRPFPN
jgi:hypothetical protein